MAPRVRYDGICQHISCDIARHVTLRHACRHITLPFGEPTPLCACHIAIILPLYQFTAANSRHGVACAYDASQLVLFRRHAAATGYHELQHSIVRVPSLRLSPYALRVILLAADAAHRRPCHDYAATHVMNSADVALSHIITAARCFILYGRHLRRCSRSTLGEDTDTCIAAMSDCPEGRRHVACLPRHTRLRTPVRRDLGKQRRPGGWSLVVAW